MRIAHVAVTMSLYHLLLEHMLHQQSRGHEVFALGPGDEEWAEGVRARGIPLIDTSYRRHHLGATGVATAQTWAACLRYRFDVVHTHNTLSGLSGRIAARLAGVPCVVTTFHSWPLRIPRSAPLRVGFRALEPIAARLSHAVLFQNPDDMADWCALPGVEPAKARLVGNGIRGEAVIHRARPDARKRVREALGESQETLVITKIARLEHPAKGHLFFLDGLHAFVRRFAGPVRAWLVGKGADEPLIFRAVEERGLGGVVRFLGQRADVPDILRASDLCALTSPFEGVPRSVMEAMALGKAVIGTDVPGTRMLVRHEETGLRVAYGDVAALSRAMERLALDAALREHLGAAARARVLAHFREDTVADRALEVYSSVLRGQALPRFDVG